MTLSQLSILHYKNIRQVELFFSPNLNCLLGNNGMGKTNLLDAIYYLSFCKSFTPNSDAENILHGEEFFMLQGVYNYAGESTEVHCGLKRKQRKVFKRDKKEYSRLSDHIGTIPLVLVSPADIELIRGGSDERRRFVDMVISQSDTEYIHHLIYYNGALMQRNAMLKESTPDESLFTLIEDRMAFHGEQVYRRRVDFVTEFLPVFSEIYAMVAGIEEAVSMQYLSHMVQGELAAQLAASRGRDVYLGYTSRGVHRDDVEMLLGEYPIKRIGSQGQNKTFLIALKLAQYEFLKRKKETAPILLLDDIFDKLDAQRVEQIVRLVSDGRFGQIFITDTNRKYLDEIIACATGDYSLFSVEGGEVALTSSRSTT